MKLASIGASISASISASIVALSSLACERPASGLPSRVPGDGAGAVLNVPYPIAEGERIEGAGRKALSSASFAFVSLGGTPDDRDHGLPERIAAEGPVLIAHHVSPEGQALPEWRALYRLGFGRVQPTASTSIEVDPEELEHLGYSPPAQTLWLVGPKGTCQAHVGAPVLGLDPLARDTIIVGYRLEGCPGRSWAQVGIIATTIPVDFRWVPAQLLTDEAIPRTHTWEDPLAALVEPPSWSHDMDPRFDLVRLREIPGAEPRVIQLHFASMTVLPGEDDRLWCEIETEWTRTDGWYNGRFIDPVPFTRDAIDPFMLGAFVSGTQVDAVIYDDRLDGLVVVPPGPLDDMDDPEAWTQVFVPTGVHDELEIEAWGVHPARGALPIGPSCE